MERRHAHCTSSMKHRSRSQPRHAMGDRPAWGINRPTTQYLKQSEKDPHYMKRLKRRGQNYHNATLPEKLLPSEFRLVAFQTDEEGDEKSKISDSPNSDVEVLQYGFRMVSNPSSPRFVPIARHGSKGPEGSKVKKGDASELDDCTTLVLERFETQDGVKEKLTTFEPEPKKPEKDGSDSSGVFELTSVSSISLDEAPAFTEISNVLRQADSTNSGSVSPEESSGVYEQSSILSSSLDEKQCSAFETKAPDRLDQDSCLPFNNTTEIPSNAVFEQTTVSSTSIVQETVTSVVYEQKTVSSTNIVQETVTSGVFEQDVAMPASLLDGKNSGCLSDENESSCPSSSRSDHKSNDDDADNDDSDDFGDQSANISQITALKLVTHNGSPLKLMAC